MGYVFKGFPEDKFRLQEHQFKIKGWKTEYLGLVDTSRDQAKIRALIWCEKHNCELIDQELTDLVNELIKT